MAKNKGSRINLWPKLILAAIFIFAHGPSPALPEQPSSLELMVQSDKIEYKLGEPINIDIILENTSNNELKLFHPDNINKLWSGWQLKFYVARPNGQEVILKPEITFQAMTVVKNENYKSLAPGERIKILVNLPVDETEYVFINSHSKSGWSALINISEEEYKNIEVQDWQKKYDVKGRYFFAGGPPYYLGLQEIIKDIFNSEGEYKLRFEYRNTNNIYWAPDNKTKDGMVIFSVPEAWTGTHDKTITIKIIK